MVTGIRRCGKSYLLNILFYHYLLDNGVADDHIIRIDLEDRMNKELKLMPIYDKIMLRKRSVIESVNDMLKNTAQLVHSRHRSFHNFIMNSLAALGAYCFYSVKPHVTLILKYPTQTDS